MSGGRYPTLLRTRLGLLRMLAVAGRPTLFALLGTHLVAGLVPAGTALATGWLVRRAGAAVTIGDVLAPLALVAALIFAGQLMEVARAPLDIVARRRVDGRFRADIRGLLRAEPRLTLIEDPQARTDIARASDRGGWRERTAGTAAVGQLTLTGRLFAGLAATVVVAAYSVPLAAGLLVATLALRAIIRRQWVALSFTYDARARDRQRVDYWADTLSGTDTAKELRLFGLGGWLAGHRRAQAYGWLTEIWPARRRILRRQHTTFLLAIGSGFAAFYWPGTQALAGRLTIADLVTIVVAAWGIFPLGAMGHEAFDIEYGTGAVRALDRLEGRRTRAWPAAEAPGPSAVEFRRTTFGYPGTARPVLRELDLTVARGEVLGIVGRNGAGKTTLVKLLAALYTPSAGRITVGGTDLATVEPAAWRRRVSVVFQDFVRYPGTVRDNVTLGAAEAPVDDAEVLAALDQAGGRELLERLPDGLDTLLTPEHAGGTDLSGGQWQRIAISRALFAARHGRHLLVLDEPTANLDVRAEAEFYDRVVAAVTGATVVLISHRLSTVRRADRIVLIEDGHVVEQGDHQTLMALGGRYRRMFELQAERFRLTDAASDSPRRPPATPPDAAGEGAR
jgi:ATP-binding cassette, subfamily B, bacterial